MVINWRDMKEDDSARMLAELKERVPELPGRGAIKMRHADLPFYQAYRFYEITDTLQAEPKPRYVLYRSGGIPEETFMVDGSPTPIHKVNELAPLKLSTLNVAEYVSFFFACVQGPDGKMEVIEEIQPRPHEEITDVQTVTSFSAIKKIIPPCVAARIPDGGFRVDAAILFKGCIFKTEIDVPASGDMSVVKDEGVFGGAVLLREGLPHLPTVVAGRICSSTS